MLRVANDFAFLAHFLRKSACPINGHPIEVLNARFNHLAHFMFMCETFRFCFFFFLILPTSLDNRLNCGKTTAHFYADVPQQQDLTKAQIAQNVAPCQDTFFIMAHDQVSNSECSTANVLLQNDNRKRKADLSMKPMCSNMSRQRSTTILTKKPSINLEKH